jgi:hypothetical protein
MQKISFLVLLLASLVGTSACDDDISSASRLQRLRLLAVQAEPPNPAFGKTTRLRPLVYVPPGESVTYEWSWCPVPTSSDNGYLCPVDQTAVDDLAALTGLAEIPPLVLGTAESIELKNPFPPTLLASLCAGDSATTSLFLGEASAGKNSQVYTCAVATLPMQVMLTIRGSTTDTGVVSLRLPIDETTAGNQNPLITGVGVISPEPARTLDQEGLVSVPRDSEVKLLAGVDLGQAESYLDKQLGPNDEYLKDDAGHYILGPAQERLTLSWFSEGGGFVDKTTSWSVQDLDSNGQVVPFTSAVENTWTTPKVNDYSTTSSVVVVVVRDSRGGVAWTRGIATLEDAP